MKKNPKKKKKKEKMLKLKKKLKKKKKKLKKLKKSLLNSKSKIKINLFGWENLKLLLKKNIPPFTKPSVMIGKTIWLLNNSQLKDNSNLKLSSSYPKELPSIYLKPKRRRITSNFTLEEFSLWTIVKNLFLTVSVSLKESLILKIYHWTFQENSYNKIKSLKWSRKISLKNASNFSKMSLKMLKTIRNSTNNSLKISNLESMKIAPTELNSLNSSDTTPPNPEKNSFHSKTTSPEWRKDKKISTSLLEKAKPPLPTLPSLNHSKKEDTKLFTWLTPSMNMLSNNSKNTMEKNSKTAPKKDLNSKTPKMKKRNSKNKRLNLNPFANLLKKFWVTKLKKSSFLTEFKTPPVS